MRIATEMKTSNLDLTYPEDSLEIIEPAMLIRINELFRDDLSAKELYDATRSCWRVSLDRANNVQYVLSVYKGIVREVYRVNSWTAADPKAHEKMKEDLSS